MSDHLVQRLYDLAAADPDAPAVMSRGRHDQWRTWTLGELTATVRRLSNALIYERLLPSETAVVMAANGPLWFVAHFAVLAAGGVSVPVEEASSDEELLAIVRETETRILLVAGERARATVARVRSRLSSLRLVVTLDDPVPLPEPAGRTTVVTVTDPAGPAAPVHPAGERGDPGHAAAPLGAGLRADPAEDHHDDGPDVVPLSRLEQLPYDLATAAEARRRAETWTGSDIAAVHYVAAPTGTLRGVVMTHESTLYPVDAVVEVVDLPESLSLVVTLPLSQALSYWAALVVLLHGGTVWCPAAGESLATAVAEVRPTVLVSTMHIVQGLLDAARDDARSRLALSDDLVEWATSVADQVEALHAEGRTAPPHLAVQRRAAEVRVLAPLRARLGGPKHVTLVGGQIMPSPELMSLLRHLGQSPCTAWGTLETAAIATLSPPGSTLDGSVGRPLPRTSIEIDGSGTVRVRGPGIMRGYYARPTDTREAVVDGWFRSGQPGRLDDDGALYLTSRVDDVILTANLRYTSARPIERLLAESPLVVDAVVLGEARPYLTALVHPDVDALRLTLQAAGARIREDTPADALLRDPRAVRLVGDTVRAANEVLPTHQRLAAFRLISTPPGSTSVTGASMTRRDRALQDHAALIESMYTDLEAAGGRPRG